MRWASACLELNRALKTPTTPPQTNLVYEQAQRAFELVQSAWNEATLGQNLLFSRECWRLRDGLLAFGTGEWKSMGPNRHMALPAFAYFVGWPMNAAKAQHMVTSLQGACPLARVLPHSLSSEPPIQVHSHQRRFCSCGRIHHASS